MPLVLVTGYPSSGKTKTSERLRDYLESRQKEVQIVREESFFPKDASKNGVFRSSVLEKEVRGGLMSCTTRLLSKDSVVIVDGSNYIKGFRYEIWCASKAAKTTQCTVYCDVSPEDAWSWNGERPEAEKYDRDAFDGLVMRYEAPNGNSRWESPLFLSLAAGVNLEKEPCELNEQVYNALYNRLPPPPNLSTQNRPLAQADFLHNVDRKVTGIEDEIMRSQRSAMEGDVIKITGTNEHVVWTRQVTRSEMSRARKQFMVYLKMRGEDDLDKIHTLFIQYLNGSVFRTDHNDD